MHCRHLEVVRVDGHGALLRFIVIPLVFTTTTGRRRVGNEHIGNDERKHFDLYHLLICQMRRVSNCKRRVDRFSFPRHVL